MAFSMKIQASRTRGRTVLAGLAVWAGLVCCTSCSSGDEAPGRRRVEHPVNPGPRTPPPPPTLAPSSASDAATPAPSPAPAAATPASPVQRQLSRSDYFEQNTGIELSPRDKAIIDDCPARSWSKKVPKRRCTNDDVCGDGFCDRGHCAVIWTCRADYGQRCESDSHCGKYLLCNDGRCSSCTSAVECDERQHELSHARCVAHDTIAGARRCIGDIGGGLHKAGMAPSLPTPGQ
jgi:hypothetical protein